MAAPVGNGQGAFTLYGPETHTKYPITFKRHFDSSVKPKLIKPDRILKRIEDGAYETQLFFSDATKNEFFGMFSIDKEPLNLKEIKQVMRLHFIHPTKKSLMGKQLLLKAVAYAVSKEAKAILILAKPSKEKHWSEEYGFATDQRTEKSIGFKHSDPKKLQELLQPKTAEPQLPIPSNYKSVTLMKKYLYMIREGTKPVEGRINTGMFAQNKLPVGSGIRFFYTAHASDDVQCTILETKTFETFDAMLTEYGYENLVPDAKSHKAAVEIYNRIPNYAYKAAQFGVIAIKLRVDGHGPNGPAFKNANQPSVTDYYRRRDGGHSNGNNRSRKRRYEEDRYPQPYLQTRVDGYYRPRDGGHSNESSRPPKRSREESWRPHSQPQSRMEKHYPRIQEYRHWVRPEDSSDRRDHKRGRHD